MGLIVPNWHHPSLALPLVAVMRPACTKTAASLYSVSLCTLRLWCVTSGRAKIQITGGCRALCVSLESVRSVKLGSERRRWILFLSAATAEVCARVGALTRDRCTQLQWGCCCSVFPLQISLLHFAWLNAAAPACCCCSRHYGATLPSLSTARSSSGRLKVDIFFVFILCFYCACVCACVRGRYLVVFY